MCLREGLDVRLGRMSTTRRRWISRRVSLEIVFSPRLAHIPFHSFSQRTLCYFSSGYLFCRVSSLTISSFLRIKSYLFFVSLVVIACGLYQGIPVVLTSAQDLAKVVLHNH